MILGHQGSAATFSSSLDLVTSEHLRNHGGQLHTPQNCKIEVRSFEDYPMNYNENLCDLRSNGKMRENGKYHNSVIEQMLFPIDNLHFIVPPTLRILLGIPLLLYNLLLRFCQLVDQEDGGATMARNKGER